MAKSNTVAVQTGGIGLDTRDFARFAKALRKAEPALAKGLMTKLRAAGMIVADEAKVLSADASRTIPPSIKVRVSSATVSVVAGGNGIPLAGLMELGNSGVRTAQASFRHPVFGNMNIWVTQPTHPYLVPAIDRAGFAAETAAIEALDEAIALALSDQGE